ncbi:MAG: translation initiation factor IF-3 [Bacteroidia bacterium]|nr:translation initiation factor IF-3 [Bacteroidia bacterium]MCE7954264.1 translation initiation factor IF-3 [Bacteroidetes bacterium CHB6]
MATFNKPGGSPENRPQGYRDRRLPQPKVDEHRINERIRVPQVRLVGDNVENKIYDTDTALHMAREMELDLVEISENSNPPVCKIIDYQKFLYERKKKDKEQKAKAAKSVVKEIRFGPNTDEHDFNFKLKHAIKFLEEGAKVKAYVHFKGRTIAYKEKGEIILLKFAQALEQYAKVEMLPKLEGNRMFLHLAPLPKKK